MNNGCIIHLSGTHSTGKTFLVSEVSRIFGFKSISNIYRNTIRELGLENIKTIRSHTYLINKFILCNIKASIEPGNFIFDRSILDPLVYGEIRNLNKNIDINNILLYVIDNILKYKKYVIICLLFGDVYELYNFDNDFFIRNLVNDVDRKNSIFFDNINKSLDFILVFEEYYLKMLNLFKTNNIFITYLSDILNKKHQKIEDIMVDRNNLIIKYIEGII